MTYWRELAAGDGYNNATISYLLSWEWRLLTELLTA